MQPSSGDVYIDDKLITEYDINQVRNAIAILSQDERMFPLSLRDNMLMGLTERAWRLNSQEPQHSTEKLVERASRLGGSWDIMRNVGLDTVLDPVRVIRQSTECVGNGKVARAAYDELDRCAATVKPVKISGGERQRLLAYVVNPVSYSSLFNFWCSTRLITRILDNNDIKLIVVDEPSSALDPIAERDLFKTFMQMRKGRTVIFVTHRFKHLVDHADLILFVFISSTARPLAHVHVGVWQMERLWSAGLIPSFSRQAANTQDYTMPKSKVLISTSFVSHKAIPSPTCSQFLCLILVLFVNMRIIIIIALYLYV